MNSARLAWAFLTRLPGGRHPDDEHSLSRAAPWFPVVGAAVGAITGLTYLGLSEVVSPVLAALAAVGLGAAVTGAFHEDGLADTFDSFGGYDLERRLEIMRDSRIGTFGTLALVVATAAKVAALATLDGPDGLGALVLAHTFGRAVALGVMIMGPEARTEGLAAISSERRSRAAPAAVGVAVAIGLVLGPVTAVAAGALVLFALGATSFFRRHLGGVTGDALGAVEQVGEIAALIVVSEMLATAGWLWA